MDRRWQATIDVFQYEGILKNVSAKGDYLHNELKKIPEIKSIRQYGLMIGVEFFFSDELSKIKKIVEKMNENNILILTCGNNGQYIRLLPPLNVSFDECKLFLDTFNSVINDI